MTGAPLEFRVAGSIAAIPESSWNALLDDLARPFMDHRWLAALEESGSASPEWSWVPRHLTCWRAGRLVAAAPAWRRETTDGDFSRDWNWAEGLQRAGLRYYPKLVLGVPYTPAAGTRFLVAPGENRADLSRLLADAALDEARASGCVSVQALFLTGADRTVLAECGWEERAGHQYHWHNPGYGNLDEFLARLDAKRRHQVKREMAAPAAQGIRIRTVHGDELAADTDRWADTAHAMHAATVEGLAWGRTWINRDAYRRIFASQHDAIEFVAAEREGRVIAGAFNLRSGDRLYGRYWGAIEHHPFLHFNVCYYHAIARCIAEKVRIFEGGAGGDHKLTRGFEPVATWSAHRFTDDAVHALMVPHIRAETGSLESAVEEWKATRSVLKR